MSNLWFTGAEGYLTLLYVWRQCRHKDNESERKVRMKWIQFRPWFKPCGTEVSSFIIQKFCCCFSHSFNVPFDVVRKFLSCSTTMIFPRLLFPSHDRACWNVCKVVLHWGFDIFSVVIEPNVEWCFWFTNVSNVTNKAF